MYDTWHWANQMMLMLIWHTVLLIVSGSKVKKADAPKMPTLWQHCCYLPCLWPANCRRFRNAAEVAARRFQPKKNNMQQTFWNARIEEFDTGFLKDWKGFSDRSPGINPASRFFLGAENSQRPCFFWELKIESSRGGKTWKTYPYKYQVHSASSPPVWIAPHHPRLDHRVFYPFEMTSYLVRFENGGFS